MKSSCLGRADNELPVKLPTFQPRAELKRIKDKHSSMSYVWTFSPDHSEKSRFNRFPRVVMYMCVCGYVDMDMDMDMDIKF